MLLQLVQAVPVSNDLFRLSLENLYVSVPISHSTSHHSLEPKISQRELQLLIGVIQFNCQFGFLLSEIEQASSRPALVAMPVSLVGRGRLVSSTGSEWPSSRPHRNRKLLLLTSNIEFEITDIDGPPRAVIYGGAVCPFGFVLVRPVQTISGSPSIRSGQGAARTWQLRDEQSISMTRSHHQ